jgi:hypothetical protein
MHKKRVALMLFDAFNIYLNGDMRVVAAKGIKKAMGRYGEARAHKCVGLYIIAFGLTIFIFNFWLLLLSPVFTSAEGAAAFSIGVVVSSTFLICGIVAIRSPEKFDFE